MKRLAAMHDWPLFCVRDCTAVFHGLFQVGAGQDEERVAAAKFQDGALELRSGRARDRPARADAAGQRDGVHARVLDQRRDARDGHGEVLENVAPAGAAEKVLEPRAALRSVVGVLEQADVARHERRRGEPDDLPKGIVPRHQRQHDAERLVAHEAAVVDAFVAQHRLAVRGVVAAALGTFRRLGAALGQRLAHLERGEVGELVALRLEKFSHAKQELRAVGVRRLPVRPKGRARAASSRASISGRVSSGKTWIVSPVAGLMVARGIGQLRCGGATGQLARTSLRRPISAGAPMRQGNQSPAPLETTSVLAPRR